MEPVATHISSRSNVGFTLIEVMVSIVILMVGLLGLLQAINLAMEQNIKNVLRSEAVQIAENKMNVLKLTPYDNISASYSMQSMPSRIRGSNRSYSVHRSSTKFNAGASETSKELVVNVSWLYKNSPTVHEIRTIKVK